MSVISILRAFTIVQLCGSSLSFIASTVIVAMVWKSYRASINSSTSERLTPYKRLIMGLSTADIFQSGALILGPFIPPKGTPQSPWAIGTTGTCDAGGFFMTLGGYAVPLYILALCIYYFSIIKYRRTITNDIFYRYVERWMHLFIVTFAFGIAITAVSTQSMNTVATGSLCGIAQFPPNCSKFGQCIRGTNVAPYLNIGMLMLIFCLLGVITLWGMVCWNVISRNRLLAPAGNPKEENRCIRRHNPCRCFCMMCHIFQKRKADETEANYLTRLYLGQILSQASLYILCYISTYGTIWTRAIFKLLDIAVPNWVHGSMAFLYSFQGVFNILIYTRPNVKLLRMHNPEYSWLYAFWTIIKNGGDLPVAESEVVEEKSVDYDVDEGFEENPDALKFPTSIGDSNQACISYDMNTSNVISYDEDPDTKKSEAEYYREMRLKCAYSVDF